MKEIKLRYYQQDLADRIREALRNDKHVIAQLPTGGGKTIVFGYIAKHAIDKGNKVLILSNRAELLNQADGCMKLFGIHAEYISPKHKKVPTGNCIVGTAQSFRRRIEKPEWMHFFESVDLFIIDEIHQQDFEFLFDNDFIATKPVIGFTATPKRSGGMNQLGIAFQTIINGVSVKELIRENYLVPARHFTLDAPDMSNVEINRATGDYQERRMQDLFDSPKRYEGVIENYQKISAGEKSICFCCSQAHAIQTCIEFNKAGIPARFLISGIAKDSDDYKLYEDNLRYTGKRGVILKEFKEGKFTILCNAAILTTGFDEPSIRTVIVNRATLSSSLWLQMIGRGSRLYEGKSEFKILDFGNNVSRHGLYDDQREWNLWHDKKEGGGVPMTKECPEYQKDHTGKHGCGRLIPIFYDACPFCGYVFKTAEELRRVELREIIGGVFEFKDMTPTQLKAYAELHGHKTAWVWRQIFYGSEDRRQFVHGMKELGYDYKHIYATYDRYIKEGKNNRT